MKYVYSNNLKELEKLAANIESFAELEGVSPATAHAFNLCLDEILTNIVSYAFDDGGEHQVLLELSRSGDQIIATISDDGRIFNPLEEAEAPDIEADIEDREVGGLGIFFVREMMDSLDYRRDGDQNILTLRKRDAVE